MVEWAEVFGFFRSDIRRKELKRKTGKVLRQNPCLPPFKLSNDSRALPGSVHRQSDVSFAKKVGISRIIVQLDETDRRCNVNRRSNNTDRSVVMRVYALTLTNISVLKTMALKHFWLVVPVGSMGLDSHTNLPLLSRTLGVQSSCSGPVRYRLQRHHCMHMSSPKTDDRPNKKVLIRIDKTSILAPVVMCVIMYTSVHIDI